MDKPTLIIPFEKSWDKTNEDVMYASDIRELIDCPQQIESTKYPLNRIICPDITCLDFDLLDIFDDVILRGYSTYMSLRELYDDMDNGGGYTERRICKEHNLLRIYMAGGFTLKHISEYVDNNGGIENIISETFTDIDKLIDIIKCNKENESNRLTIGGYSVNGNSIEIELHSVHNVLYETVGVTGHHINFLPLKNLVLKLFTMCDKDNII